MGGGVEFGQTSVYIILLLLLFNKSFFRNKSMVKYLRLLHFRGFDRTTPRTISSVKTNLVTEIVTSSVGLTRQVHFNAFPLCKSFYFQQ